MIYSWLRKALKQGLMAMKHSEPSPLLLFRYFLLFRSLIIFFKKIKPSKKHKKIDVLFLYKRYVLKNHYCWEQRTSATSCSILIRFSTLRSSLALTSAMPSSSSSSSSTIAFALPFFVRVVRRRTSVFDDDLFSLSLDPLLGGGRPTYSTA
jgi:hypothetical protein